jgi:hypothetical protein
MRGSYHMEPAEEALYVGVIKECIELLKAAESEEPIDLTRHDIAPCHIKNILVDILGWEKIDFDENGWEQDTWYYFSHPDYDFQIIMFYCGYTFELNLYKRGDEEDGTYDKND